MRLDFTFVVTSHLFLPRKSVPESRTTPTSSSGRTVQSTWWAGARWLRRRIERRKPHRRHSTLSDQCRATVLSADMTRFGEPCFVRRTSSGPKVLTNEFRTSLACMRSEFLMSSHFPTPFGPTPDDAMTGRSTLARRGSACFSGWYGKNFGPKDTARSSEAWERSSDTCPLPVPWWNGPTNATTRSLGLIARRSWTGSTGTSRCHGSRWNPASTPSSDE